MNEKNRYVGLFFYVHGEFLFHKCSLDEAEEYGDFLIDPEGHSEVWDREYADRYGVDYDFFPRGRIAYRRSDRKFRILYDRCIGDDIQILVDTYDSEDVELGHDEHYQCHGCNHNYICLEGML